MENRNSIRGSIASKLSQTSKRTFISPTSSFVDFTELESEYYTEEGRALAQFYNPHAERRRKKPTTDFETCMHLLKGSIGAGLLAMPKAFSHAGVVVGIIGTFILGSCCIYAMDTLIRTQFIQCKRLQVPFLTFPRSMKIAFLNGPKPLHKLAWLAPFVVDFFLIAYQIGICTAYVVFIAESIKHVAEPRVVQELDLRYYYLLIFVPIVLINYIRNLKVLMPVSLLANLLIVVALGCVMYYIFGVGSFRLDEVHLVARVTTWPLFIGTVMFALEAVGVIIALEHNMGKPQHFLGKTGIFPWSLAVVISLYMIVGLLGYLKYGNEVSDTIISSLPRNEWLSLTVEGVYALCIYGTYPLQCYVSLEILWGNYLMHHIKNPRKELCFEYAMRTIVVTITFLLAVLIPYVDIMIALVGAFCLSTLGMVFPFLLELCTLWPDEHGRCYYIFIKDVVFIIIGLFILVIGTYVALHHLFKI